MGKPSQNMEDLAKRCKEAGWKVSKNAKSYICTSPRGRNVHIPCLAADAGTYERTVNRLRIAGLEQDEAVKAVDKKTAKKAVIARDRERNDRLLEAVQAQAAASPAMTIPAAAAPPVQPPKPDVAVSPNRGIPAAFVGVAGLLSLDDDFDLDQIVVKPEDRPKPSRVQTTVYELVTPERALELLTREPGMLDDGTLLKQRTISPVHVKKFTAILQRDLLQQREKAEGRPSHAEWIVAEDAKLSPEPPLNTGGVVDSQHRFTAVRDSNIPAIMRVTYNTPPRVFLGIGQPKKRTDGDIFKMKGIAQSTHYGSASKLLYCWHQWRNDPTGPYANWRSWSRMNATTIQLEAFAGPDGPLWDDKAGESLIAQQTTPGSTMMMHLKCVPAAGIAFRVMVLDAWKDVNPDLGAAKLEEFCTLLHDGAGPGYDKDHPAWTLREWLTRGTGKTASNGDARSFKREFQVNGMLRAFDYFANSRELGKIIVSMDAPMPEAWAPGKRSLTETNKAGAKRR